MLAFIFARGGSKGIPKKNLQLIRGRSLLRIAIETALGSTYVEQVLVSTDDADIAEEALRSGAIVPFQRSPELSADESAEILAWRDAINFVEASRDLKIPPFFLSIPTTTPLRSATDIDGCVELYLDQQVDLVVTVSKSARNPFFNMVTKANDETLALVCGKNNITRRQDAPQVFDITTGAYVANIDYLKTCHSLFEGRVRGFELPQERALDIDTPLDLEIVRMLSVSIPHF